ncbi:O-antigen ligase family protein [Flavobacterium crassostreae]|nr:O-antigen ligase family protein [Flavobacterium crassostreae]
MILATIKKHLFDLLFVFLIMLLFFSLKAPNIILISLIIILILDFQNFKKIEFKLLKIKPFFILAILFIYWILKAIITHSILDSNYSLLLPIVIIPILFLKVENKNWLQYGILWMVLFLSVRAYIGLIGYYIQNKNFLPFEGEIINEILGMERPYLGFISVIAIIIALQVSTSIKKYKIVLIGYAIYISIFVVIISARISVLTVLCISFLFFLFYSKVSNNKKVVFFLCSLFFMLSFMMLNKNLRERFFITSNYEKSIEKLNRHEPRMIIWNCSYRIMKSEDFDLFFGLNSTKELEQRYLNCYDQTMTNRNRANYFISTNKNSHNQFIAVFLTSGILGLFIFCYFFGHQFYIYRRDFFKIAMLVATLMFFVVENVLMRQTGVYLFALIISLINIPLTKVKNKPLLE